MVWRRKWQPTPVFLPGGLHGLRSLVGYSPWGHKESDKTEQLTGRQGPVESPPKAEHPTQGLLVFYTHKLWGGTELP